MLTQYVHPRLGLPKFLTFEPYFITALRAFERGEDTKFEITGGLSPSTIAARMRDAIQGYRLNATSWAHRIDPEFIELFTRHDGKFVISGPNPQGEVWFRARRQQGGHLMKPGSPSFHQVEGQIGRYINTTTRIAPSSGAPAAPLPLRAKDCEFATIASFVGLKSAGHIEVAVIFPGPLNPQHVTDFMASHDIAFHFDASRNETILV